MKYLNCIRALRSSQRYCHPSAQIRRGLKHNNVVFQVSEEVRYAVDSKQPVVALESTIYSHGSWSYPDSFEMALNLEKIVRSYGATPATIAIVDGVARVGLDKSHLERLLVQGDAQKLSRRDLGRITGMSLLGKKLQGGTTIAGTMVLAHLAGIKVFATGGLGGVHRGVESSMDISADLTELGRTPVAVVCSGCKGFLDIPRTLEYLETEGVVVATFADGRTGSIDFPAFWSRNSGLKSPSIVSDEKEAAAIIHAQSELSMTSGLLFANPVPSHEEIPLPEISNVIDQALQLANEAGVSGSANTPFVLNMIRDITKGKSIKTNYALVESNITRGSKLAVELSKMESSTMPNTPHYRRSGLNNLPHEASHNLIMQAGKPVNDISLDLASSSTDAARADVFVAGAVAVDLSCNFLPSQSIGPNEISPKIGTSNPGIISHSLGGVAHNIAKTLHLLGSGVQLFSAIGDDLAGKTVLEGLKASGLRTDAITTLQSNAEQRTAQYVAINDAQRNLYLGMADMGIMESPALKLLESPTWKRCIDTTQAKWLVLDANLSSEALANWLDFAHRKGLHTAFEPVSYNKSQRLFESFVQVSAENKQIKLVDIATPNSLELEAMHSCASKLGLFERQDWWTHIDALGISSSGARVELVHLTSSAMVDSGTPQQSIRLLPFIPTILTKLGPQGVLLTKILPKGDKRLHTAAASPYILSHTNTDADGIDVGGVYMRLFPSVETLTQEEIVSVNGAGDTFLGSIIAALNKFPNRGIEEVIDIAQHASVLTLKSKESVNPNIRRLLEPRFGSLISKEP